MDLPFMTAWLDDLLDPKSFNDFCVNGLCVEANDKVTLQNTADGDKTQGSGQEQSNVVNSEGTLADTKDTNKETATPRPCGPTTLNAADAEKWDCVPDIGYWCTDPAGCPVNGQIAKVDTRLVYALPLPQGTQYEYLFSDSPESSFSGFVCAVSSSFVVMI